MEILDTVIEIKNKIYEDIYNSEDLTERQDKLVNEIIDKLWELIDELKK